MYCGICVEVCPFDALFWSPEYEYSSHEVADLIHGQDPIEGLARDRPRASTVGAAGMTVTFSDWITELANWVFLLIAVPTVAAAFFVVTAKNVVRAVLALVVTLAGTAALFLMLGAEFVGWTVVLVYIGAVVILFLMGIMITQSPLTKSTDLSQPDVDACTGHPPCPSCSLA